MNPPAVSVIVVNHNGEAVIRRCLQSLMEQTFTDREVIVVDNASRDRSVEMIRAEFPSVRVIEHPVNAGFAGGNVQGLRHAGGEYIALLNNDAVAEPEWLVHLVEAMRSDPLVGICASKLLVDGTDLIDSAGDGCTTASRGYKRGEGASAPCYDRVEEVFGGCGAAVLYRRARIERIGFFDEEFFLLHEDTDLNVRARPAGWRCMYVPKAVVRHRVHSTIGRYSDRWIYCSIRNADLVWLKNSPTGLLCRYLHHKVLTDCALYGGMLLWLDQRWRRLGLLLRAKADVVRLLPRVLRQRHRVQGMRTISNGELRSCLTSIWDNEYLQTQRRRLVRRCVASDPPGSCRSRG